MLGKLTLARAYYYCATCKTGFCPRDRALGLVSFREGSLLLRELAGVDINAKRVERCAKKIGAEVAADENAHTEPIDKGMPLPKTFNLSMDGTGIPVRRSEVVGRTGKQPDGSAKTREVKLCVIWSTDSRDGKGKPICDEGSVSYSAAIESAAAADTDEHRSEFAQRDLYPAAEQIGDRFHVKEHLSKVAKDLFAGGSQQAKDWTQLRWDELDAGSFDDLLCQVQSYADRSDEARKCAHYLDHNRKRMRYPEFEANGYCTSSGVTEAGCKNVIGTRLKRSGMHWTVRGANAIIALRCCILSGRFQDVWERIVDARKAA